MCIKTGHQNLIVAAGRVRQGPLYRGSLCIKKKLRESKKLLWAGDLYTEFTIKACLTLLVNRIRLKVLFFRIHFTYVIQFLLLPVSHLLKSALPFLARFMRVSSVVLCPFIVKHLFFTHT